MRQLVSSLFNPRTPKPGAFKSNAAWALFSSLLLGLIVAGCGHSSTKLIATSISITPTTSISMKYGDVRSVAATILDQNGNQLTNQKFVWTSSNTSIATVTATGGNCGNTLNTTDSTCLCAGTWNSDFTVCKPPTGPNGQPQAGTATITATGDGLSTTITALVHAAVSRVSVAPANVDCLSAGGTQQLTASAYDSQGNDITSQVAVDSSSFNWLSSDSTVASINNTGLTSAINPGRTSLYASIAGTSSAPASFTTCPVVSVSLVVGTSGTSNSFSIAQAATQQLTPTVIDSNGKTITVTSGRLSYDSSYPISVTVNSTGLATGANPGNSTIVASCSPPTCNNGLYPVYSNVVRGTTQGTTATGTNSKVTQVLVASTSDTQLVPIDITTAKVGTSLTLPYKPNSMVYSRASDTAYLGSDTELMSYTYSSSSVAGVVLLPGVIVDLSTLGRRIVLYDDTTKTVTVYSLAAGIVDKFSVPNATPTNVHASTSPDDQTTYVVVGNQLFISTSTNSLRTITLNAPANDVAFLLQGSFAYLAGGENNSITARATCDSSEDDVVAVSATPDRIIAGADGTKMYAVAGADMGTVTATTTGAGCPPALTDSSASVDMGQGTISPKQIFTNSAATKVYMISGAGKLIVYDTAANTATSISLSGGATATTGALTMDGANLWVGGGADKIAHRIDTSTNTDAQQITVPVSADLVVVKNQ